MATLIEQMLTKMGLRDEPSMQSKTLELLRILELRSSNAPLQLNEYAKTVLCADIATTVLGIACDMEQNVKLSTLRKSHYNKHKRMIEKILDVNKIVGVNDICVQLNITEVSQKAVELLELYKTIMAKESANDENDLIHPQYAAMAVFQAAKILKQKSSKAKIMSFSNLRPTQWQQLELRWNKFLTKYYKETSDKKQRLRVGESNEETESNAEFLKSQSCVENKKRLASSVEDYEQWKKRILAKAEEQLRHQLRHEQQDELRIDKENLILGM